MSLPGPKSPVVVQSWKWNFKAPAFLRDCRNKYGKTFSLRLFKRKDFAITTDNELVKFVFSDTGKHLQTGRANAIVLGRFIGQGSILVLDGQKHKTHRRIMMPCFHGQILNAHAATMKKIAHERIEKWPSGEWVSLLPLLQDISLEIIVQSIFGFTSTHPDYPELMQTMRIIFARSSPWSSLIIFFPAVYSIFKNSPVIKTVEKAFQTLTRLISKHAHSDDLSPDSILFHFMKAQADLGENQADKLTDTEIAQEMIGLLLAGNETTAIAMAWATYWFGQDVAVEKKLCEELKNPNNDPLQSLWWDSFLKETLRISPIFVIVGREIVQDFEFNGHKYLSGGFVAPSIYLMNNNPDVFTSPEQFILSRFIDKDFRPHEYFPFGGGDRRCIGYALAPFEIKIVLAELIKKWNVELKSKEVPEPERRGLAFTPKDGLIVRFHPKNNDSTARSR